MEQHFIAGYYVVKTKPSEYKDDRYEFVATMSSCINLSVFDDWCLSWANNEFDEDAIKELELSEERIIKIQEWADKKIHNIGNTLPSLELAQEFKNLFFKERDDIKIYSLSLPKTDAEKLLLDFAEGNNIETSNCNNGDIAIRKILLKKIEDKNTDILGYDFIGIEGHGAFHSFHCHGITKEIEDLFGLNLNSNGLFDEIKNPVAIRAYLNNPKTAVERVPWYIARVKLIQ